MGNSSRKKKINTEQERKHNKNFSKILYPTELMMASRIPMPDHNELEKRFAKVLASMDLPPDKAKVLKNYEDDKKWDLICDQERVTAKQPPEYYLRKLQVYLDPTASKSSKKRRILGDATSTQTLRDLEISLRTNHIEWVREFLSEQNMGLDILIDYLSYTQVVMRNEMIVNDVVDGDDFHSNGGVPVGRKNSAGSVRVKKSTKIKNSASKLNLGDATDDVHVCIMCLRAIMNHQYGFNLVFGHSQAINCISLSLNHKSLRTKALVLELLAAVCLVSGGHERTLSAFDNFKEVCNEKYRFETLMSYFKNFEEFHIDFMVACMQFINIVVHSVEEMNYRVHLQHEFTLIGLDTYLMNLRNTESDRLSIQVNAYLDNMIDVAQLLEDSDTKSAALEKVHELEDSLSHANERAQEIEDESLGKIAGLETHLNEVTCENEQLKILAEEQESEMATLKRIILEKDEESQGRQSALERKLLEIDNLKKNMKNSSPVTSPVKAEAPPAPAPPPPPAAPPPPFSAPAPPPPPPAMGGPPPPPPPGGNAMPSMTIKKKIQPKYRLPVLNWISMKPNQVKGTVFSELDDEKLYKLIDFYKFEELFKLGNAPLGDTCEVDGTPKSQRRKQPEKISLLETNRLRNCAITRRKIELTNEEIMKSINGLDLKTLSLERVEILIRIVPNEQEVKLFREYEQSGKPVTALADEDRFMINLLKVERLSQKLTIMSFIGNFFDTYHHLQPQLNAVIAASMSIKNSQKIKKLLEIVLAFGNYMNSAKRGAVYGFKLQSLDMLIDTKSADKKLSLLHFIVQTVREKFPELQNFDNELRYVEKAATVSLENIVTDLSELGKGMLLTKKEYEARKDREPPMILHDFLTNSEDKLKKLNSDLKTSKDAYETAVDYFGENSRTLAPNTFFSLFVRFVKAYKQAEEDLNTMAKLELAARTRQPSVRGKSKIKSGDNQEAIVSELKKKQKQIQTRKINREEVYHGALEDILLDLKNEPYRRADALRKSQKRKVENDLIPTSRELQAF